ncbi:MAG: Asp/Glu racemase [Alphaproteobacteria bacterium]|nr:Asp/Glu racemase [Alphaproteobacteria bacterium]
MKLEYEVDDGIGSRAKLGVIVLETDETLEPEFSRMTDLDGVALYHSRIAMETDINAKTLARMEQDIPAATRLLPARALDVIGYGCTSGATIIGPEAVARAVQSECPDAQVTNPLTAIIAAGQSLQATRLAFVTPYVAQVSLQMREELERAGFEIAAFGSFEQSDDRMVARITPQAILKAALSVAAQAPCDAIVISCTNLRCLGIIPKIEAQSGLPTISSNQALAWHMLRLAKVNDKRPSFGRLFTVT